MNNSMCNIILIRVSCLLCLIAIIEGCGNIQSDGEKCSNCHDEIQLFLQHRSCFDSVLTNIQLKYSDNLPSESNITYYFINCRSEHKLTKHHICDEEIIKEMDHLKIARIIVDFFYKKTSNQYLISDAFFVLHKQYLEFPRYYHYHIKSDLRSFSSDTYKSLPIDNHWSFECDYNIP